MDMSFHYLLMANQAMIQKELLDKLAATSLSPGQPKVLDFLGMHDGANQKEIAVGCHIEPPTLSSILGRMEESGLIQRRAEKNNRRTLYVYLTEKGKNCQKQVEESFREIEKEIFGNFSEEERQQFMSSYMKIYNNLKKKRGLL